MSNTYLKLLPSELKAELFIFLPLGAAIYYCLVMRCHKKYWTNRFKIMHPESKAKVNSLQSYIIAIAETDELYSLTPYILRNIRMEYEAELTRSRKYEKLTAEQMPKKKYFIVTKLSKIFALQYNKYVKDTIFIGYNYYDVYLKVRKYVKDITGGKGEIIHDLLDDFVNYYKSKPIDSDDIIDKIISELSESVIGIEESELIDDPSSIDQLISL